MKKLFVFAAVAAILATVASCNKSNAPEAQLPEMKGELTLNSVALTKGYVTAALFYDTAIAQLHATEPVTTPRQMYLSAYLTPQNGEAGNYFVDEPFAINANGETDGLWHHEPKIYWPLEGAMDFLAYSAQGRLTGTKCVWDESNASKKLILNVSEAQSQDDIVYAAAARNKTQRESVPMEFKHSQAWIEFQMKASAADLVFIKDIVIENIYQKGELTITNTAGVAEHSWNFASYRAGNVVVDNNYELYDEDGTNSLGTAVEYLDMLIPEQGQTAFVMRYQLAGQDTILEYRFPMTTSTWEAGKKYVYQITITPVEITVTPTVVEFSVPDVSGDGFPSNLS
jgi:hypothetical protein